MDTGAAVGTGKLSEGILWSPEQVIWAMHHICSRGHVKHFVEVTAWNAVIALAGLLAMFGHQCHDRISKFF